MHTHPGKEIPKIRFCSGEMVKALHPDEQNEQNQLFGTS